MKNFKVIDRDTGKEYWISRSMAVAGFIVAVDEEDELYVLLERRGPGCPDNVGKLCGVCGYIDYDETRIDAMLRETYEETGFDLKTANYLRIYDIGIKDDEFDGKQNITQRYMILTDLEGLSQRFKDGTINTRTEERGGEKDEVSEFVMLPYSEIEDIDPNEFAFGHKEVIDQIVKDYL